MNREAVAQEGEGGPIPGRVLIGAGALIGFTMLAVAFGRTGGVGVTEMPPANPVQSVTLRVDDQADGSITVRDAANGALLATVEPGQDNFIRATLRGFGQSRLRAGLTREEPFRLTRYDDGSLELGDDVTGRKVNLGAFGPANAQAFTRILPASTPAAGVAR
ncbi:MAG TPA: photosynthetic complex assembly protein PuhC [Methylobacterium sp.]|jgi:putative photosynthetic complex assembly protein